MTNRRIPARVIQGVGAGGARYEILEVPNELAVKAGTFRANRVDTAAIAARIAKLGESYPEMVLDDINRLMPLWARARGAEPDPQAEDELFRIAHDLTGQSTTFGYTLVSAIAVGLRLLLEGGAARREHAHPAVAAHIAALEQTVRHAVRGGGGEAGKQILAELHAAVDHCARR